MTYLSYHIRSPFQGMPEGVSEVMYFIYVCVLCYTVPTQCTFMWSCHQILALVLISGVLEYRTTSNVVKWHMQQVENKIVLCISLQIWKQARSFASSNLSVLYTRK